MTFVELRIDDRYVLRMYREKMQENEFGNLSIDITLEEWNEHVKNIKESYDILPKN
jgi:hypothetical protein